MTSEWRRSRRSAEYREFSEDINDALYALVIIKARNEQLLNTHTKEEIREKLEKGIKTIDSLLELTTEPIAFASPIKQEILEDSDVTLEELQRTRDILTTLKKHPDISGEQTTLSTDIPKPENVAEETLEEIDQTASRKYESKYGSSWDFHSD